MPITKLSHTTMIKGPMILLAFRKEKDLSEPDFVKSLCRIIRPLRDLEGRISPQFLLGAERYQENSPTKAEEGDGLLISFFKGFPGVSEPFVVNAQFYTHRIFQNLLPSEDCIFLSLDYENQHNAFGPQGNIHLFLEKVKNVILEFQPLYAGGDVVKLLDKTTGKDPRQYCWAYNYFSSKLVETVGKNNLQLLSTQNPNWNLEYLKTGGIIFRLTEPFEQFKGTPKRWSSGTSVSNWLHDQEIHLQKMDRRKEYADYKREAQKVLGLKKLFGGKKPAPLPKVTRESYGSGSKTRIVYDDSFTMMFAVRKEGVPRERYLAWLKALNKEFKGNYHDSLLGEWADMFANGSMDEGVDLGDIIFDFDVVDGAEYLEKYADLAFIGTRVGLNLFDRCSCYGGKHAVDCEHQRNVDTTVQLFTLAVTYLQPQHAFLGHEAEMAFLEDPKADIDDFLFSLTFRSDEQLKEKGVQATHLRSPVIKVNNGIIIELFSYIFSYGDDCDRQAEQDAEMLGLEFAD